MQHCMAVSADQLKVGHIQGNARIMYVVLVQVNLVVNNFAGYDQTILPADLADPAYGFCVQFPQVLPVFSFVEVPGKFSGHDFTHEESTVTKPCLSRNEYAIV